VKVLAPVPRPSKILCSGINYHGHLEEPPLKTSLSERVLLYGQKIALPKPLNLRAGPLRLFYEAGDLRYIKFGEKELVRRWYTAVRDRNWGTVPPVLSRPKMKLEPERFEISYQAEHQQAEIDFGWQGRITGDNTGEIIFTLDGVARSTFLRARIGFCLLHPMQCAGDPCEVTHPDGTKVRGRFPRSISPEAPFVEIKRLAQRVRPGLWMILEFKGDIFEMEDQRNWGDASYKTFCTPLRLPYPAEIPKGAKIRQSIALTLDGRITGKPKLSQPRPCFEMTARRARGISKIGLGVPIELSAPDQRETALLQALNLSHLRLDLSLENNAWPSRLREAAHQAASLNVSL